MFDPRQPVSSTPTAPLSRGRFLRAVVIALLLTPLMAYWSAVQLVDVILSLLVPPVGATIALVALNLPLRRFVPRLALSTGEMVLIYAMLATATAIAAEWMICQHNQIAAYALFANESNKFDTLMLPYLSRLLFLTNAEALGGFKAGGHGWDQVLRDAHLWARPVLGWTFLVAALSLAMISINSLMRQQWTQRERLAFPIIQFPCALVEAGGARPPALWRDPALWVAFAIMLAIDAFNGLHFFFPSVPVLKVRFLGDLNKAFSSPPWNTTGWTPIGLFPFIVGLASFLPTDLTFSMVVFFFFRKAQQVIAASLGYPQGVFGGGYLVPSPPYFGEQTWGAFLALFVTALWSGRLHLRRIGRQLWRGGSEPGDVAPRWAVAGLVAGLAGVLLVGRTAGFSPAFGLVYVGLYLAFSTALARMRAELGPPTHEMAFMGPNQLVVDFAGTHGLTAKTVVGMASTFYFFNRLHRSHPMPGELEAMKIAEREQVDQRWMFVALWVAVVAGSLAAHTVRLYIGYRWGAPGDGWAQTGVVNDLLSKPRRPNPTAIGFVALGFAMVLGLNALRFRLPGFWLHPVGYALAMNFGVDYYWFGLLVALALKWGVLRVYGLRGYRRLHAAMMGIMLAEFTAETVWSAVAMIWRVPTYSISINGRLGWME